MILHAWKSGNIDILSDCLLFNKALFGKDIFAISAQGWFYFGFGGLGSRIDLLEWFISSPNGEIKNNSAKSSGKTAANLPDSGQGPGPRAHLSSSAPTRESPCGLCLCFRCYLRSPVFICGVYMFPSCRFQ